MAKIKIETEVSKEIYEAAVGLGKFGLVVKQALADGWQAGTDLTPILSSALVDLAGGLNGIDQAGPEFAEDPMASVDAALQGLKPLIGDLVKPKA